MIDDILSFNRTFVAEGRYEPYRTDKWPAKRLAILSCMDTRLTTLLPAALGIRNGDAKVITNAGGIIQNPFGSAVRSLLVAIYELGVEEVMVVHHTDCGACHMTAHHMTEAMVARGVRPEDVEMVRRCGIDLDTWLEGFHDTERSVRETVALLRHHPLLPPALPVRGFIMDSVTGALQEVDCA